MRLRDTAFTNRARTQAGEWLKRLREARGLSQRDLARDLGLSSYIFLSQLETGRRSIPTYMIRDLAAALGQDRAAFALELLRNQDPFTYAAIYGDDRAFEEALQLKVIEKSDEGGLREPLLEALTTSEGAMSLVELRDILERQLGRELHYQSVSQALRRLGADGLVQRRGREWAATDPRA